jgi:hypothetical protein
MAHRQKRGSAGGSEDSAAIILTKGTPGCPCCPVGPDATSGILAVNRDEEVE